MQEPEQELQALRDREQELLQQIERAGSLNLLLRVITGAGE